MLATCRGLKQVFRDQDVYYRSAGLSKLIARWSVSILSIIGRVAVHELQTQSDRNGRSRLLLTIDVFVYEAQGTVGPWKPTATTEDHALNLRPGLQQQHQSDFRLPAHSARNCSLCFRIIHDPLFLIFLR